MGSRPALRKTRSAPGRRTSRGVSNGPGRRKAFTAKVYAIVRAIPPGRVMTYGGIASLIPPPAGINWTGYARVRARWVGYSMAECPEDVPWQRVVNAQGRISPRNDLSSSLQRALLKREGVRFDRSGRIDLDRSQWKPSARWLRARGLEVDIA